VRKSIALISRGYSPLLFIIYVNDLFRDCSDGLVCQYADDTTLLLAPNSMSELSVACSRGAAEMSAWCKASPLRLNLGKTGLMLFSKREGFQPPLVWLHGASVPSAQSVKFLGVHLDPCLRWERLISYGICFWGSWQYATRIFVSQKRLIIKTFGGSSYSLCLQCISYSWFCLLGEIGSNFLETAIVILRECLFQLGAGASYRSPGMVLLLLREAHVIVLIVLHIVLYPVP